MNDHSDLLLRAEKSRPHPLLFSLQSLVTNLAHIERRHHHAGRDRAENDVEHSFAVAVMCWFVYDKHNINLDLAKILKYALTHDFTEVYVGDVNTYASVDARSRKAEQEKLALVRLRKEFEDFKGLGQALHNYDTKADEESLFVWTVDKMQMLVLGDLDDWRPFKGIDITYDAFLQKNSEHLTNCSPYCKEIFTTLVKYCKTTYYDRPRKVA